MSNILEYIKNEVNIRNKSVLIIPSIIFDNDWLISLLRQTLNKKVKYSTTFGIERNIVFISSFDIHHQSLIINTFNNTITTRKLYPSGLIEYITYNRKLQQTKLYQFIYDNMTIFFDNFNKTELSNKIINKLLKKLESLNISELYNIYVNRNGQICIQFSHDSKITVDTSVWYNYYVIKPKRILNDIEKINKIISNYDGTQEISLNMSTKTVILELDYGRIVTTIDKFQQYYNDSLKNDTENLNIIYDLQRKTIITINEDYLTINNKRYELVNPDYWNNTGNYYFTDGKHTYLLLTHSFPNIYVYNYGNIILRLNDKLGETIMKIEEKISDTTLYNQNGIFLVKCRDIPINITKYIDTGSIYCTCWLKNNGEVIVVC